MLEYFRVSQTVIEKLHNSSMGHLAIAYMCYKLATPLRYMVTIGKLFNLIKKKPPFFI